VRENPGVAASTKKVRCQQTHHRVGEVLDRFNRDHAAVQCSGYTIGAAHCELLVVGGAHKTVVHTQTAVLFFDTKSPDAQGTNLLVQIPRNLTRLIPGIRIRFDFFCNKTRSVLRNATRSYVSKGFFICQISRSYNYAIRPVICNEYWAC
tara:strand:+ start:606 stop:1055 length:450 start_codon:yes stop_codon:yes gene_type:complete